MYAALKEPVALEEIKADAGLDIGLTLIGMHLKKVAVPVRLENHTIGAAMVVAAHAPQIHRRRESDVRRDHAVIETIIKKAKADDEKRLPLLYPKNHVLDAWFKREPLAMRETKKLLLL